MRVFNADKPIDKHEDDILGRNLFADSVAQIIVNQIDPESHVIGIYGKWGSGKTSTVNLIQERIHQLAEECGGETRVLAFSSWGSNSVYDVFTMFFNAISNEITVAGRTWAKGKTLIGDLIEYGTCLSCVFPPVSGLVSGIKSQLKKQKSLSQLKDKVAKSLRKRQGKLVVVIDDIDRLSDEQIKHVFQFVSIVADFPNVVYILPFDYEVVAEALSGIQGTEGSCYMSKVVQIPLYLPDPSPNSLIELLDEEVGGLIDPGRDDYDKQRMRQIIEMFIQRYMKTPRDVRRLQNTYVFQMGLFSEGLNSLDLLALSCLMAFDPVLFGWIKDNKDLVLGSMFPSKQKTHDEDVNNSLQTIGIHGREAEDIKEMLSVLFPALSCGTVYGSASFWRERRVCHREIFDGYFSGRSKESWLSSRDLASSLYAGNIAQVRTLADKSISNGTFLIFLEEVSCRINMVDNQSLRPLGEFLIDCWGKSSEEREGSLFLEDSDRKIEFILKKILKVLGQPEADAILLSKLQQLDVAGLAAMAPFLNGEELAHGRLAADSANEERQHLSLDGVEKMEKAFARRISELKGSEDFLECDHLYMAMYLWSRFDEDEHLAYWRRLIEENPLNVCYLLSTYAGKWISGEVYGWTFSQDLIEQVMPKDEIDSILQSLRKEHAFSEVSDAVLEKTIAFYQIGFSGLGVGDEVTGQSCRERFSEWRGEDGRDSSS